MREQILSMDESDEYFFEEGCFILELSNSSDDPQASIARARVEPGVRTRRHRLDEITERYVILEGQGLIEVAGLAPQTVTPGDVVVIPAGHAQRITNTATTDLVFLAICTPRFSHDRYRDLED